jgi:hypothetical protein
MRSVECIPSNEHILHIETAERIAEAVEVAAVHMAHNLSAGIQNTAVHKSCSECIVPAAAATAAADTGAAGTGAVGKR